MPTSIRTQQATPNKPTPRLLAYVPLPLIPETLEERNQMGEGVKEIPLGTYLASKLEAHTRLNRELEKQGKIVIYEHEKLERGEWKLRWCVKDKDNDKGKSKSKAPKRKDATS